jgi:hypothetical protein
MDAFMRGQMGAPVATSKPEDGAPSGEPAPQGDVEAGRGQPERGPDGKFLPRRGAAEAVRTAEERVADLERQLAERDPKRLRAQWENERTVQEATQTEADQAKADAERYERLRDIPDRDLSDDDYRWREDQKGLLTQYPKARQAMLAEADRRAEAQTNAWGNAIAAEVQTGAAEFGVDPQVWAPGTGATWLSMTRDAVAAQTTPLKARIAELERELHSSRTVGPNGFGTVRVPALSGNSGGGTRSKSMDDWLRGR